MLADVCGEDTSVGLCVPASTDVPVVLDKVSPRYSKQKFTYMLVFLEHIFTPSLSHFLVHFSNGTTTFRSVDFPSKTGSKLQSVTLS